MITQTQSRVVRDATLKHTLMAQQEVGKLMGKRNAGPCSVTNRVRRGTNRLYDMMNKCGSAISLVYYKSPKGGKHDVATFGAWDVHEGRLSAEFYKVTQKAAVENHHCVEVSRHAIERISQRLKTIDTKLIRTELIPAVVALAHHHHQGPNHPSRRQRCDSVAR